MKTLTVLIISLVLTLSSVAAFSKPCPMLSEVKIDQYVHVVLRNTPKGHIKGKVLSVDESTCILTIRTTDEYHTYHVDVACVAAIGIK